MNEAELLFSVAHAQRKWLALRRRNRNRSFLVEEQTHHPVSSSIGRPTVAGSSVPSLLPASRPGPPLENPAERRRVDFRRLGRLGRLDTPWNQLRIAHSFTAPAVRAKTPKTPM